MTESTKRHFLFVFSMAVLILWFVLKVIRFQTGYYFSDLYSQLQLSNFWLRGEAFLFENRYGSNLGLHNYFFSPLMAPFTYFIGAYGLFVFHFFILSFALIAAFLFSKNTPESSEKTAHIIFILALLLGPYSYWIWDNSPFGWHAELLYIPFGICLSYALLAKKKWQTILFAASVILIREDGILVVWAIMTLYHLAINAYHLNALFFRKWAFMTVLSLIIFIAGIWFLQQFGGTHSRLEQVFDKLNITPDALLLWVGNDLGKIILFLTPVWFVIVLFRGWKVLMSVFIVLLPLFVTGILSGFWYYPVNNYSLLWQPRTAALLVVAFSGFIFAPNLAALSLSKNRTMALVIFVWLAQYSLLYVMKDQDLLTMTTGSAVEWRRKGNSELYKVASVLSKKIPVETFVAIEHKYFNYFHRHKIVWPDIPQNNRQEPEIVICSTADTALSNQFTAGYDSISYPPFYLKIKEHSTLKNLLRKTD